VVDSLALALTVRVSLDLEEISIISILASSFGVEYSALQMVILNLPEEGNRVPSPVVTTIEVSSVSISVVRSVLALLEVFSQL
jgi:hypothetical protein